MPRKNSILPHNHTIIRQHIVKQWLRAVCCQKAKPIISHRKHTAPFPMATEPFQSFMRYANPKSNTVDDKENIKRLKPTAQVGNTPVWIKFSEIIHNPYVWFGERGRGPDQKDVYLQWLVIPPFILYILHSYYTSSIHIIHREIRWTRFI